MPNFIYDIIPPGARRRVAIASQEVSKWIKFLRVFLKTSRYGIPLLIMLIVSLGTILVFAFVPSGQEIEVFPTEYKVENWFEEPASKSNEINWQSGKEALQKNLDEKASLTEFSSENSAILFEEAIEVIVSESESVASENEPFQSEDLDKEEINTESEDIIDQGEIVSIATESEEIIDQGEVAGMATESKDIIDETIEEEQTIPSYLPEIEDISEEPELELEFEKIPGGIGGCEFCDEEQVASDAQNLLNLLKETEEEISIDQSSLRSYSIIFSGFDYTTSESFNSFKKAKLMFSWAAKQRQDNDVLLIEYRINNNEETSKEWKTLGIIQLNEEYSNYLDNGYWQKEISDIDSWMDLRNLEVKFTVQVFSIDNKFPIYLDSVWISMENIKEEKERDLRDKYSLDLISEKRNFKKGEDLDFRFNFEKKRKSALLALLSSKNGKGIQDMEVSLLDIKNRHFDKINYQIQYQDNEDFIIILDKDTFYKLRPGRYKLKIEIENEEGVFIEEQEFAWGVLAINTNKSIYLPGERIYLQMATLDSNGHTICNSNLELEIINPLGQSNYPRVETSGFCGPDNVVGVPDYFSYYSVVEVGEYKTRLTNLDTGYEIIDSFQVAENVPFEIERIGPTRIYPKANYEMKLKIKANQNFQGNIVEFVPSGFKIITKIPTGREKFKDGQVIIWRNIVLGAGDSIELKYEFDAPNISPYLYVLGPIELRSVRKTEFKELRQWQIASDAPIALAIATVFTDTNDTSSATTTWQDVPNTTISDNDLDTAGSGIANGDTVLLIADIVWEASETSNAQAIRIGDTNGNEIANTTIQREGRTNDWRDNWSRIMLVTTRPTDAGFVLQKRSPSGTGYPNVHKAGITIMNLEELASGSDYIYDEFDDDVAIPESSTTRLTTAEITTPASSDWQTNVLIMDYWLSDADAQIDTDDLDHSIWQDDTTEFNYTRMESEDANDWFGGGSFSVLNHPDSSSHTYKVKMRNSSDNNTGFDHKFSSIFAIRSNVFEDFYYGQEPDLQDSAKSYAEIASISPSFEPQTSGNFMIMGQTIYDANGRDTADDQRIRIQVNGSTVPSGFDDSASEGSCNENDGTEHYPILAHSVESFSTGTSYDIDFDAQTDEIEPDWYSSSLVAFSMELNIDSPKTTQLHFRWRDNSTDLNTSGGWLDGAVDDSNAINDISKNTTYRLRINIANTGALIETTSRTYEIQYAEKTGDSCGSITSTSWIGIGDASDEFDMVDTTHISPDGETIASGSLLNDEEYVWVNGEGRDVLDTTSSIGPLSASYYTELEYSFKATDDAVTGQTYCFRVYDTTGKDPMDSYSVYPEATIESVLIPAETIMEWGTESGVSSTSWSTINFSKDYNNPVFICAVNYNNNIGNESDGSADSVLCRVQNIASSSVQVMLQVAGNLPGVSQTETVHWLVVEEGDYDDDDIKMEAWSYTSTTTYENGNWTGDEKSYSQSYTTPVVLGQVMTYNDSDWSTFFARSATQANPPNSSELYVGKTVKEDTDLTRNNELIGVVIIEQDNGTIDNTDYEAYQGTGNAIDRIDEGGTTDTYTFQQAFSSTPTVGIVSQTGINGGDGPHPVLYGATSLTTTTINSAIMEDEIADTEMGGSPEDVAYMVFESAGTYLGGQVGLDQTTYRFYENIASVQPGSVLANENTAVTDIANSDVIRLRTSIQIGFNNLATSSLAFELQWAQGSSCSGIASNSWNTLGTAASTSAIWRGYDNGGVSDEGQIAFSLLNSQDNYLESYEEENNSISNLSAIPEASRGEWDWVIQNNGAAASTDYCFRMVTSNNDILQYTNYPKLTTAAGGNQAPTVSNVSLNNGGSITLIENTTISIVASGSVTDADNCSDISSAKAIVFMDPTNTASCSVDNNNCYTEIDCTKEASCSGNTADFTCDFSMYFYANPTADGASFSSDKWTVMLITSDSVGQDDMASNSAQTVEVNELVALEITAGDPIQYNNGSVMLAGQDTEATNETVTIKNTGNRGIDVNLQGTNLTGDCGVITVGNQQYASVSFTYNDYGTTLTDSNVRYENGNISWAKPTSATPVTNDIYWGIGIPVGTGIGACSGTNTFSATEDN